MKTHPSQRFQAPSSIQTGIPLKELLGRDLIRLVGESIATVVASFDKRLFQREALKGLDELEFSQRGQHIGRAIAVQLPTDFDEACPLLIASLGPELLATEGNGLAPFFYLPHGHVIAEFGVQRFESGMLANYELTKRMTAEFSIRPFLVQHRDKCLARLAQWVSDPNPHVRRLVSEGTRPRLPWAMRLKEFQENPHFTLPLLERLKDDPELYVRRSVANHLADILKDHPAVAYEVCKRWLEEIEAGDVTSAQASARRWIVRHAIRLPAKKSDPHALKIRTAAR
jgi:3-methyladenine DNA glycosylase AlkC